MGALTFSIICDCRFYYVFICITFKEGEYFCDSSQPGHTSENCKVVQLFSVPV